MKIENAVFIVIDVETTGLDPQNDHIVEIAAVATSREFTRAPLGMWATLVRPPVSIPPEASAIHGITNYDVAAAPDLGKAMSDLTRFWARFGAPYLAAHNAEFDSAFGWPAYRASTPWLCTKRLAMHLWPQAPAHKNQVLRYWLRPDAVETFGIGAHRALGDALVTAQLLRDELTSETLTERGIETVEQLIEFAESPILMEKFPFGKHRGQPIGDVPPDYMRWCLREMKDLSRDMRFTLESALAAPHAA